jgi:hypothetical protein
MVYEEPHLGVQASYHAVLDANEAASGLLLHYSYAADHGCFVKVFRGSHLVARLKASFEGGAPAFDVKTFIELGLLTKAKAMAIARWFDGDLEDDDRSDDYAVAREFGLTKYRWFSFRYESDKDDPKRIEIGPATTRAKKSSVVELIASWERPSNLPRGAPGKEGSKRARKKEPR